MYSAVTMQGRHRYAARSAQVHHHARLSYLIFSFILQIFYNDTVLLSDEKSVYTCRCDYT